MYPIVTSFKISIYLLLISSVFFITFIDQNTSNQDVFYNNLIASLILLLRVFVCCCFALSYQMAYLLFPPLLRSKAFSIANGVARPLTMLAPFMIRIPKPMSLLVASALFYYAFLSIAIMPSPEEMKGFNGASDAEPVSKK